MIEHVNPESSDVQGLILAPTRELAIQICDELRSLLAFYTGIRVTVLYGGASLVTQAQGPGEEAPDCGGYAGPADGSLQPEEHSL